MRSGLLAVLLLAPALAGCTGPEVPSPSCERLGELEASNNAPLADPLGLAPDQLARRLADAVDDPVLEGPREGETVSGHEPALRWTTRNGTVVYPGAEANGFQFVRYWGTTHFTPLDGSSSRGNYRALLQDVGLESSEIGDIGIETREDRLDGTSRPEWNGEELEAADREPRTGSSFWETAEGTNPDGYRLQVTLGPMYDLSEATAELGPEQVRAQAELAVRCEFGFNGSAADVEPQPEIAGESLAFAVSVLEDPDSCDARHGRVWIDAVTGASLHSREGQGTCVR